MSLQSRSATTTSTQVTSTILEVIQGPCEKTQEHFCLTSTLCEVLNRIMRSKPVGDCVPDEEDEVRHTTTAPLRHSHEPNASWRLLSFVGEETPHILTRAALSIHSNESYYYI